MVFVLIVSRFKECVCEGKSARERESVYVCKRERERERECVCKRECVPLPLTIVFVFIMSRFKECAWKKIGGKGGRKRVV